MRNRRRNNVIIGTLCCVLVLMGVGYAILSTTLNIGGTANINSDFNIHFLTDDDEYTEAGVLKRGITLIDYENSTSSNTVYNTTVNSTLAVSMESSTGVDTLDPTEATFSAILQKPTDYATFTAIAKNYGTIKGKISSVNIVSTPSQELTTWLSTNGGTYSDYFEVTTTAAQNTVLNPEGEYEFTITVRFKESADKLPQGALNNEITITYVQDNGQTYGNDNQSYPNDAWRVNSQGTVISYDPADLVNGYLTIPATDINGNNIVGIDSASFIGEYNIVSYSQGDNTYAIIYADGDSYNNISDVVSNVFGLTAYSYTDHSVPQNVDRVDYVYINPTKTSSTFDYSTDLSMAIVPISTLDLRSATHLTRIDTGAFMNNSISEIKFNNVIQTIGDGAFYCNQLTGTLVIPSSLQTIGDSAFKLEDEDSQSKITALDLSNATSLISIGEEAFYKQGIGSLNFSSATHLTTIGQSAFNGNRLTGTLVITPSITTIGNSAFCGNTNYKLSSLNLSNATGLTTIGRSAFAGNNLTSLDMSGATHLTIIGDSAFENSQLTGTLVITPSITEIGEYAFRGSENYKLTALNLSNATGLTTIGMAAFSGNNLTSLDMSGATHLATISDYAFSYNSIQTLTLPSSITSIGTSSFGWQPIIDGDPSTHTLQTIYIPFTKSAFETAKLNQYSWYDGTRSDLQLIYTDVTCNGCNGYNNNCVAN